MAGCPQVLALEPLHREVRLAVGCLAVGDELDDGGVAELGEDAHLALEARALARVPGEHDLDGDGLTRVAIARAEDLAHAARPGARVQREAAFQHIPHPHFRAHCRLLGSARPGA
ncbi:hypothetical protein BE21_40300 [Sorangium cellulosum]|uniref:Uncharacterized protein n=1 Tax=Sorangium cellulosum TaxID=56 RepID=A0A150TLA6_SORCE|nr:hypothetical protein BE21_40300 [Sorangium cellulosum]